MPVKIALNPDNAHLSVKVNAGERQEVHGSFLETLRRLVKRAKQIAKYPWFEKKRAWQKEIQLMLKNAFKLEVEALISKDISYVTETYVPERLEDQDFLD